jgi:hypothetical protein
MESGYSGKIPTEIKRIIGFQNKIGQEGLKNGIFSKLGMILHYLFIYQRYK